MYIIHTRFLRHNGHTIMEFVNFEITPYVFKSHSFSGEMSLQISLCTYMLKQKLQEKFSYEVTWRNVRKLFKGTAKVSF